MFATFLDLYECFGVGNSTHLEATSRRSESADSDADARDGAMQRTDGATVQMQDCMMACRYQSEELAEQ